MLNSVSLPEKVYLTVTLIVKPIPLTVTLTLLRSPSLCLDDVAVLMVTGNSIKTPKHPYLSELIQG